MSMVMPIEPELPYRCDKLRGPALRYFGAKWRLAPWIVSHFPPHVCYVEPFGGSAAVLLQKAPSKYEVYNDRCSDVVNFFQVLRERSRELMRALRYTPYSREEFERAHERCDDALERARRFFVTAWQGYGGPRGENLTGWKIQRRAWHSGRADQLTEWQKAKLLGGVVGRLRHVQIEHDDALNVITRWDTPETLFYVDPPYPAETRNAKWVKRGYNHEISGADHYHLANLLKRIQGKAVISTYPNPLYDELFMGWKRVEKSSQTMNKTRAIEVLYFPETPNKQTHEEKP